MASAVLVLEGLVLSLDLGELDCLSRVSLFFKDIFTIASPCLRVVESTIYSFFVPLCFNSSLQSKDRVFISSVFDTIWLN